MGNYGNVSAERYRKGKASISFPELLHFMHDHSFAYWSLISGVWLAIFRNEKSEVAC